jgi:hypothetical protein
MEERAPLFACDDRRDLDLARARQSCRALALLLFSFSEIALECVDASETDQARDLGAIARHGGLSRLRSACDGDDAAQVERRVNGSRGRNHRRLARATARCAFIPRDTNSSSVSWRRSTSTAEEFGTAAARHALHVTFSVRAVTTAFAPPRAHNGRSEAELS